MAADSLEAKGSVAVFEIAPKGKRMSKGATMDVAYGEGLFEGCADGTAAVIEGHLDKEDLLLIASPLYSLVQRCRLPSYLRYELAV